MKKILIVERELPELAKKNSRIILKKNITIIKDVEYMNDDFIRSIGATYKYLLESWEVFFRGEPSIPEKICLLCGVDGHKLKPVHVITHINPMNGSKCLFQVEKTVLFKISNGVFDVTSHSISLDGIIEKQVIRVGQYKIFEDIKKDIPDKFYIVIDSLIDVYDNYKKKYEYPIYAEEI